ncbi:hypothetical protein Gasu2_70720 [Galdieria sulphuraria]|nr:hypothetical protein Gasu2_70720 [Galdieria sulphuraria]
MFKRICIYCKSSLVCNIVGEEGNISRKSAADLFFPQHIESHSVEACVWIVYKVALKDIHEGWVELLQYHTSANIDAVVSD